MLLGLAVLAGCHPGAGVPFPSLSVVLDPASGRQGTSQVVIVRGTGTDFTDGECSASFPGGEAEVSLVRAEAPDRMRLLVEIPSAAPEGPAELVLQTPSGEFTPDFTILPAGSEVSAIFVPDTVVAGYRGDILVVGEGTHFEERVTAVSFAEDSYIGVLGLSVESETLLRVWVDVPTTSPERTVAASVSTRSQVLGTTLHVLAAADPCRLVVEPPEWPRGTTVEVTIAATCDDCPFGDHPVIDFPGSSGITVVGDIVVLPADTEHPERLVAELEIAVDATIGPHRLRVTTAGGCTLYGDPMVLRDDHRSDCTFLSTVRAGDRDVLVQVLGRYTRWAYRGTTAVSSRAYVTVESVTAYEETLAVLGLTVAEDAPAGLVPMTLTSGGESVTCNLTVEEAARDTCACTPETLEHPAAAADAEVSIELAVGGLDLEALTPTLASEAGSGLRVRSFRVLDGESATAEVRISRDAPWGVSDFVLEAGGSRIPCRVVVSRADPDPPGIVPGYLLIDGRPHDLSFVSPEPSFLDGTRPWPVGLRAGLPGIELDAPGPPAAAEWGFTALPALSLDPGHATIAAHGREESSGRARHLAARVDAVPLARVYGEVLSSPVRAGGDPVTALVQAPPGVLGADTFVGTPAHSGITAVLSRVIDRPDGSTAVFWLAADQSTPPGDHVLVLVSRGIAVPAVVEVLEELGDARHWFTGGAVGPGADVDVTLAGEDTAWSATTRAVFGAADPDIELFERLAVTSLDTARVHVRIAPAPVARAGGHVVWMRTDRTVDTGFLWLDRPAHDVRLGQGWLHAGRSESIRLEGGDLVPSLATIRTAEGLASASITSRGADSVMLDLEVEELPTDAREGGLAVFEVDLDGSGVFVALVVPVLPAPPSVSPTDVMLARRQGAQTLTPRVRGLDLDSGISARVAGDADAGDELRVGLPSVTGSDTVALDAALALDARTDGKRWIVFLAETGAAALRVLPAGAEPAALAPDDEAVATVGPGAPDVRTLSPAFDGLTAVRASCDDPSRVVVSLVAPDGLTQLYRAAGTAPPHAVSGSESDDGPGFVVVESAVPTTCTLRHRTWLADDRMFDLGSNDDVGEEEWLPLTALGSVHLARLDEGYDIDRFEVDLPRAARIEAFAAQPDDYPGRTELALEVVDEGGTVRTADPWDAGASGTASVGAASAGRWRITVRAVAGSDGPYVLSIREPVLIDELDLWSGGPKFVEISAMPGTSLDGWRLVHRSPSGSVVSEVPLSELRDSETYVVAATPFPSANLLWPGLAAVSGAATLALVDESGRDVDVVGLAGAPGEGDQVVPPSPAETPTSLGRCFHVDTGDNASDFWRLRAPSPGAANVCEY